MKLAIRAYIVTLILLTFVFAVSAQQRSEKDSRNTAPTVGTGGPVGGPTGLFTVYDGTTLRKGEYTFSVAYSNYDRDPGDVDFDTVPLSFQIGVGNNVELFFATEAFRGIKVHAPRNLSGFYLPNSQVVINGRLTSAPAIVLAPGTGSGILGNTAVFRPTGTAPFLQFPFFGSAGNFGIPLPGCAAPRFGQTGCVATTGPFRQGNSAGVFPGVGSAFGSILPGIVLTTVQIGPGLGVEAPGTFAVAPSYLADAPFLNREYGSSSFNSFDFGAKWRMNSNDSAFGYGLIASYRWYTDNADGFSGFNQMQRGSGPGANNGDINLTFFADSRLAEWANLSANVGYTYTTNPKGKFGSTELTLLDRPDEVQSSVGLDFPVNKYLQYIFELRALHYVGGHTPNAFERNPIDGIAGLRVFPRRWWSLGAAYRYNFNEQDKQSFDNGTPPAGFQTSTDPAGFITQLTVGRRDKREASVENQHANVDSVDLNTTVITLPCPAGKRSKSGACNDNRMVSVATKASDPENDVLTYNYTVSGGRVIGTGANVQWDMSTAQTGTYTITTAVDDGCGFCGKTNTQTIKVQECPDCEELCSCPSPALTVQGPTGLTTAGDTMTFTATVGGDVTYNWTVSSGTIESGQGTQSIVVRTTKDMADSNVTATVEIGGLPAGCSCPTSASETAGIPKETGPTTVDDITGVKKDDEIKALVDNFYIQLGNDPNATGYVINYGSAADIKKRKAQIDKAIAFRKYDRSRIKYVDGPDNGGGVRTKFTLVPAGVTPPNP